MSKFILKYNGLLSADKVETAKACLIAEFSYGAEEAEFYLTNPPIDLLETESESEATAKLEKLLAAGAKAEIIGQTAVTKPEIINPPSNKKDDLQELIFELEDSTETKSETPQATHKQTSEPVKQTSKEEIKLEFESSDEPADLPKLEPTSESSNKPEDNSISLEFELNEDPSPKAPPATPAKEIPANAQIPELSADLLMDDPVSTPPTSPQITETAPKSENTEKHIEMETSEKTVFQIDTNKVLLSNPVTTQKQNKKKIKIPSEYIIPLMAGAGVILVMAYILFPSQPNSSLKDADSLTATTNELETSAEEEIKFYKYSGELKDNAITAKANFTATDKGLKFVTLDVATPFASELTPEEIVLKKDPLPWISKLSIDKLDFTFNKETGTFDTSSQVRAFLEHGDDKVRIVAPIIGRAKYQAGQKEFQAAFLIKYNAKEIPAGKSYGISAANETYSFLLNFRLQLR